MNNEEQKNEEQVISEEDSTLTGTLPDLQAEIMDKTFEEIRNEEESNREMAEIKEEAEKEFEEMEATESGAVEVPIQIVK